LNSPAIHSRLPNAGTTIFAVMSGLATEHKAVNLGQGFPDYPMSERLISLVNDAMKKGYNQYAPMPGWMPLREAIAEKIEGLYGTKINPDTSITITPGGTYAIYSAFTAILQPGDEVIVFEPAYDSYIPNIEVNGGKAIRIGFVYPDYHIGHRSNTPLRHAQKRSLLIPRIIRRARSYGTKISVSSRAW
jgi:methionine aminotransferase